VPVQITYSERGVGAAGRGWDVPLSYIRDDTTVIRRRPKGHANVVTLKQTQLDDPFHTYEVELEVQDLAHLTRIVSALRASVKVRSP